MCVFVCAPVTKQGESPLAVAVRKGSLDVIKCLVKECNANVNRAVGRDLEVG